ncbi:MAG: hypothetical protein IT270_05865, partial [Saprospiraceae bacterium]|nr:hypothetical protein [Saprospiraceae bacterium]
MKTLSTLLSRIATWKTLLLFLALYIVFVGFILKNAEAKINALAGQTIGIIDLKMDFNPQRTLDMVAAYGDAARAYYAMVEMTADVAYPIVYAFLLGIILTLLFRNTKYARVHVLPFLVLLFDYAENINIVYLLKTFPSPSMAAATLCEVFK